MARNNSKNDAVIEALKSLADGVNKINDRITDIEQRVNKAEQPAQFSGFTFGVGRSTDAKDNPVSFDKEHEPTQEVEQDLTRELKPRGPAAESLDPPLIEPVKVLNWDKIKLLKFMEETMTIIVHDTTNETDDPIPHVTVNSVNQYFIRGTKMNVKRKFVQILARAKRTSFGNEKYTNAVGDESYRYPAHTAPEIQFSVIHDPSGSYGLAWLDGIRAEAA
jgi:hypothetical protein